MSILGFCSFQLGWVPDFGCIISAIFKLFMLLVSYTIVYRWCYLLYMCHIVYDTNRLQHHVQFTNGVTYCTCLILYMILAGCSSMYTLQIVLFTLHSNCYFLFLLCTLVHFKRSNYDLVDGFQFFIHYSILSTCTISILIRLLITTIKMH